MLGYVKIYKPELKIKDYEIYKGVYCSICKRLGRKYGIVARAFLSYDFTFLAILRLALEDREKIEFCNSRCSFNPLVKCKCCKRDNSVIDFVTDCVILVAYYKFKDNINDSHGLKKIPFLLALPYIKVLFFKAKKSNPEIEEIIRNTMNSQKEIEQSNEHSIDKAAEPTAWSMSEILSYKIDDEDTKRIYSRIGYCLGRWIYISDAADDFEKDRKNKNYNPFLLSNKTNDKEKMIKKAEEMLELTVSEIIDAYNLLDDNQLNDIIKNIIYYGLYNEMNNIFEEGGKQKNEKSI